MGGKAAQFDAAENNLSSIVPERAAQAVHQSGLAGTVGSYQANTFTFGNLKLHIRKSDKTAKPFLQSLDRQ